MTILTAPAGSVYATVVILPDGTTMARPLIVWAEEGESRYLVTYGTTHADSEPIDQPASEPFIITVAGAEWLSDDGGQRGRFTARGVIGRYVARDERYNGVPVMVEGFRRRIAAMHGQGKAHHAVRDAQ